MDQISFPKAVLNVYEKAFDYKGVTQAREFWLGFLWVISSNLILFGFGTFTLVFISPLLIAVNNICFFSAFVRRLRDAGYSPWFAILLFIPIVSLILIYFLTRPSVSH